MSLREHPIWEEELMPYVDGQLEATKASVIARHLEVCESCARAVADARGMSQQMITWKVEDFPEEQSERVLKVLRSQARTGQSLFRQGLAWWTRRRVWAYGLSAAFVALVFIMVVVLPSFQTGSDMAIVAKLGPLSEQSVQQGERGQQRLEQTFELERSAQVPTEAPSGPMIIRSARLIILTKDFDGARARIEAIVAQSQGYLDQLTARGEVGSGRTLSAILHLPSDRIETALSELRKIGKSVRNRKTVPTSPASTSISRPA